MSGQIDPASLWALVAVVFGLLGFAAYYHGILTGRVKPHLFSWLTWLLTMTIAAAGQISGGAGPGAWASVLTAIMCLGVVIVAWRVGEKTITTGDRVSFALALAAIPLWIMTDSPLWSIILVTGIDAVGFYPTFRKSWMKPREESLLNYMMSVLKHVCALMAMSEVSLVTSLYPASLVLTNGAFVLMVAARRLILYRSR